ncbi:MAG: pyrroline-5-carboxylate reductase [Endomicrobium sp.]|jgi:pyrroline-5-carboxylate reductase|nr:pyrroline-5-carboxylate reductase [Endomicrobium sp.]
MSKKLFFIGSGNMTQAIISGILEARLVARENIICNDTIKEKLLNLRQKFGVSITDDKGKGVLFADIIVLSVKPQNMIELLSEIKNLIKGETIIISIAAGITTKFIENNVLQDTAVIRAMPNTSALVLSSVTALCKGKFVSNVQLQEAKHLFSAIGKVKILDEEKFDVITALSGSGTGYIFYFCELMQKAAKKLGLDEETAREFAVQTVYGSGKMLYITRESPKILKERVKSPNGTTEAALNYFDSENFSDIVYGAMKRAMERSKELSK